VQENQLGKNRKVNRDELFGNTPQQPLDAKNEIQPDPQQQVMGKTRMINEIQMQIKSTFDSELEKLRSEMNSRQRALRDQMEHMKADAEKAMKERNEANEELKRMKELLDK